MFDKGQRTKLSDGDVESYSQVPDESLEGDAILKTKKQERNERRAEHQIDSGSDLFVEKEPSSVKAKRAVSTGARVLKVLTACTVEAVPVGAVSAGLGGAAGSLGTEILTAVGQPGHDSHEAIHSGAAGAGLFMFFAALMYKLLRYSVFNNRSIAHRTPVQIVGQAVALPTETSMRTKAFGLANLFSYFLAVGLSGAAGRSLVHHDEPASIEAHEKLGTEVGTGIAVIGSFFILTYMVGLMLSALKQRSDFYAPMRTSEECAVQNGAEEPSRRFERV